MIDVAQTIRVRQVSDAHHALIVTFNTHLLRIRLNAGTEERQAVLECALQCNEFSEIYIPYGQGEFELVWYYRPDVITIQACVRWPIPQIENARLAPDIPFGACPPNTRINCNRNIGAAHTLGVLSIDANEVYVRIRNGMSEGAALSDFIRGSFADIIERIQGRGREFVICSYIRTVQAAIGLYLPHSSVYNVTYGEEDAVIQRVAISEAEEGESREQHWNRYTEAEHGNIRMRSQLFSDNFLLETLRIQSSDETEIRNRCVAFCQAHDPDFIAAVDFFRRPDLGQWRLVYSIRQPSILPDADPTRRMTTEEMDRARARRAERFRNDTITQQELQREEEMESEYRRVTEISRELEAKEKAAFARARERVAKEKQVEEKKTGLRAPRPNIISDDDSED